MHRSSVYSNVILHCDITGILMIIKLFSHDLNLQSNLEGYFCSLGSLAVCMFVVWLYVIYFAEENVQCLQEMLTTDLILLIKKQLC